MQKVDRKEGKKELQEIIKCKCIVSIMFDYITEKGKRKVIPYIDNRTTVKKTYYRNTQTDERNEEEKKRKKKAIDLQSHQFPFSSLFLQGKVKEKAKNRYRHKSNVRAKDYFFFFFVEQKKTTFHILCMYVCMYLGP